jgi:3,4-dihydroxy-2-butanone 4-phosphate synthase
MFSSLEHALQQLKAGGIIIVADDEHRENEGDLVCLAQHITAEQVNFMVQHGRGLVCAAISPHIAAQLKIPLMVQENSESMKTAFTVSVDCVASFGITTGISAPERAITLRHLANPQARPQDFARPGHIFPIIAHPQGFAARRGHTEAVVALADLAKAPPVAVICEVLKNDGTMARRNDLAQFAKLHNLAFIHIGQIMAEVKHQAMAA